MSNSLNPSREIRKAKQEKEKKNEDEALEHELMLVTHAKKCFVKQKELRLIICFFKKQVDLLTTDFSCCLLSPSKRRPLKQPMRAASSQHSKT